MLESYLPKVFGSLSKSLQNLNVVSEKCHHLQWKEGEVAIELELSKSKQRKNSKQEMNKQIKSVMKVKLM